MSHRPYHIEDLLLDEGFRNWVFGNSREDENFWNHWWKKSPEMRWRMKEARKILLDIQPHQIRVSREEMDEGFMEISEYFDRQMGRKRPGPMRLSKGFLMKGEKTIHYRTGKNQHKRVVLPDGSAVYMNEQTKITYYARWQDQAHRRVELQGEAFFHVEKKQRQGQAVKFSVVTPDIRVEVLGTRFDVSTGQGQSRVYLSSGKIKLNIQPRQQTLQLKPGDMVKYNPNSRELQINKSTPHSAIQWLEAFKANHPAFSQNNRMTIGSPQSSSDKKGQNNSGRILQQGQNNSAHIRQVGSNLTSLQIQQGQGNKARAILKGNHRQADNNKIRSTSQQIQQGQDNISIMNIMEAYNTHVQSVQLGQRNRTHARSKGSNNRGIILQTGQANEISLWQQGNSNEAVILQSGASYKTGSTPKLTNDLMKGQFNEIRIIQQGAGHKAYTRQQGNHNKIKLRQKGN